MIRFETGGWLGVLQANGLDKARPQVHANNHDGDGDWVLVLEAG